MSPRLSAVAAVAASLLVLAPAALTADLDYLPQDYSQYEPGYEPGYEPKYGSRFNGPHYPDPYANVLPPRDYAGPPRDLELPYAPPPTANGKGFAEPPYPPAASKGKGFAAPPYAGPRYTYREPRCVPRRIVRRRLRVEGWRHFHDFRPRGPIMLVCARRPSGRPFNLAIDRCSGEIVDARPVRWRHPGPFAFGPRRGRFWSY